jgi:hypothetical protein
MLTIIQESFLKQKKWTNVLIQTEQPSESEQHSILVSNLKS